MSFITIAMTGRPEAAGRRGTGTENVNRGHLASGSPIGPGTATVAIDLSVGEGEVVSEVAAEEEENVNLTGVAVVTKGEVKDGLCDSG